MKKKHELTLTAEMVRRYRDATGVGMMEAKAIISADLALAKMEHLVKEGTLEEKVDYLLKREVQAVHGRLKPASAPPIVQPDAVGTYDGEIMPETDSGLRS